MILSTFIQRLTELREGLDQQLRELGEASPENLLYYECFHRLASAAPTMTPLLNTADTLQPKRALLQQESSVYGDRIRQHFALWNTIKKLCLKAGHHNIQLPADLQTSLGLISSFSPEFQETFSADRLFGKHQSVRLFTQLETNYASTIVYPKFPIGINTFLKLEGDLSPRERKEIVARMYLYLPAIYSLGLTRQLQDKNVHWKQAFRSNGFDVDVERCGRYFNWFRPLAVDESRGGESAAVNKSTCHACGKPGIVIHPRTGLSTCQVNKVGNVDCPLIHSVALTLNNKSSCPDTKLAISRARKSQIDLLPKDKKQKRIDDLILANREWRQAQAPEASPNSKAKKSQSVL
ncbi:hypothetical protein BDR26DRAFT_853626 [Obelidium mucronatum]|nr:hypothetical protein BDR26DRAFT_853626 [Obelidium mucronatum]